MLQSFLSKLLKKSRFKILSYRRCGENGNKTFIFQDYLFTLQYAAELALSR